VIFDDGETIIDANPAACSMLATARTELIGKHLKGLLEPSNHRRSGGERLFSPLAPQGERNLCGHDGQQLQVEHQVTFNFSPGLHLVSIRDITERKRSEQRALQAERLAAIGETMTALAHESRNALQRSFACLEMLALEVEDRPAALDLLARARKAQEQLRQLYEEVRQWAAPINLQAETTDLTEIWREAWHNVLQVHRSKQVKLQESVNCEPLCRVDASKIGQVFRNILENAVEVSPDQSTVELHCAPTGTNDLTISIRDSGPGLSSEQLARAFEPFFTTKTKGTGLGLAIAKRIVQAHQGVISASSSSGACIQLTIPRGTP
jgi:two-component system, LuxR family, sensor kinase FixL